MESVRGTVSDSVNEGYFKGAPMKMPTLRDSSGNKPCNPVCRRAFSERSRWLAFFHWLTECFPYHFRRESFPYTLAPRTGCARAWNRTRAGASPGFQRQRLWSLSGGQERKCPPRHEGQARASRNPTRGHPQASLRLHAHQKFRRKNNLICGEQITFAEQRRISAPA